MSNKKEYVCIFIFDSKMDNTALVRKIKGPTPENPNGQIGKLNGWGGGVEPKDLNIGQSCLRELKEEMGYNVLEPILHFKSEEYRQAFVHYFYSKSDSAMEHLSQMNKALDGSYIEFYSVTDVLQKALEPDNFVWNTPYLILMAKILDTLPPLQWPKI